MDIVNEALLKYGQLATTQSQAYKQENELRSILSRMDEKQFNEYCLIVNVTP